LQWLDGRLPSEMRVERDFSAAPLAQWVAQRDNYGGTRHRGDKWRKR
jgi:hypothetical protein